MLCVMKMDMRSGGGRVEGVVGWMAGSMMDVVRARCGLRFDSVKGPGCWVRSLCSNDAGESE